jgi:hypothetical protein
LEELQAMSRFAGSTRGGFATRGGRAFRSLRHLCGIAAVAGCLALGCTINPVVSDTQVGFPQYDVCEQAAANYCELVVKADDRDLESCVAKYAFQCVSGTSE